MAVSNQDHGCVPMAVAAGLPGGRHQALDLGRRHEKNDDTAEKVQPAGVARAQLPCPSNGSFCFPNFDLKSTRTLLSQLDSKPEVCRDDGCPIPYPS